MSEENIDISCLKGKILTKVQNIENREIIFYTEDGEEIKMYHEQDCCEDVFLEDICGEWEDIIGEEIVSAYETTNRDDFPPLDKEDESYLWTFYHITTFSGAVSLRWYGTSNGYYSESVSIEKNI